MKFFAQNRSRKSAPRRGRCAGGSLLALAALALLRPAATAPERPANHLKGETSPYLLQHAHNPVDWYPWGEAAFQKARKDGKPIFLSIGYAACHWCHVMERESFEDEGIAQQLNERFVCIKVDREERPDIDDLYMTSVQLLEGRGGWPLSVFLRPDGRPFHGGTYYPREPFSNLLREIHEAWRDTEKRKQIDALADRLTKLVGDTGARLPQAGAVSPSIIPGTVPELLSEHDATHGGFGGAPKFPMPSRLAALLSAHRRKSNPAALKAVTLTLRRMARGGVYDQVGGGFHRYSVDARWLVPHFEKMLYDNALLAPLYLQAHRLTGDTTFRRTAVETLDFLLTEMRDPRGGFWSSLDADSATPGGEREEGRYYVWTPDEIKKLLGPKDAALFNRLYGVTPGGNFEGRSIPNLLATDLAQEARTFRISTDALQTRLAAMRSRLRQSRSRRPRPALDDKVLADWNGLAISALAEGYEATGDARYRSAAEKAADFIWTTMRAGDGADRGAIRHSYRAGRVQPVAFLEDQAFVAGGLLALHRVTGDSRRLSQARELADVMLRNYWDASSGLFYPTAHHGEKLVARLMNASDGVVPSGASMAARVLVRLARGSDGAPYRAPLDHLLNRYATELRRSPRAYPNLLVALGEHYDVVTSEPFPKAGSEVQLSVVQRGVAAGGEQRVALEFRMQSGWHVNSHQAAGSYIPTRVEVLPPHRAVEVRYPTPTPLQTSFAGEPLSVFKNGAAVYVSFKGAGGGPARLRVRYQACNDRLCAPPQTITLTVPPK